MTLGNRWALSAYSKPEPLLMLSSLDDPMNPIPVSWRIAKGDTCRDLSRRLERMLGGVIEKCATDLPRQLSHELREQQEDAALIAGFKRVGLKFRDEVLAEGDLERVIAILPAGGTLEIFDAHAELLPWEVMYSAELDCFLGEKILISRPMAHRRLRPIEQAIARGCDYHVGRISMLVRAEFDGHAKKLVKRFARRFSAHRVVSTDLDLELAAKSMGAASTLICHCELQESDEVDGAGLPALVFSDDVRLSAAQLALLGLPHGAVVFLLACQVQAAKSDSGSLAIEVAKRVDGVVLSALSLLPAREALRVAMLIAAYLEELHAAGAQEFTLNQLCQFVRRHSRALRMLLRVYGPASVPIRLESCDEEGPKEKRQGKGSKNG